MLPPSFSLDQIEVPSPCMAAWDEMKGTDRVRFCDQCRLHVYNLSAMSQKEAMNLLERSEGNACVRFYCRVDGTLLTQDCQAVLEAAALLSRRAGMMVLAAFAVTFGWIIFSVTGISPDRDIDNYRLRDTEPFKTIIDWFNPPPPPPHSMGVPAFQGKMK
ncbi:MAG: hypothetical protein ACJ8FY_18105 [Gemmataceae bacterium]